jgi:hypothetical protein
VGVGVGAGAGAGELGGNWEDGVDFIGKPYGLVWDVWLVCNASEQ